MNKIEQSARFSSIIAFDHIIKNLPPFGKVGECLHHKLRDVSVALAELLAWDAVVLGVEVRIHEGSAGQEVILQVTGHLSKGHDPVTNTVNCLLFQNSIEQQLLHSCFGVTPSTQVLLFIAGVALFRKLLLSGKEAIRATPFNSLIASLVDSRNEDEVLEALKKCKQSMSNNS